MVAFFGAVTLFFSIPLARLSFHTSIYDLLIRSLPDTQRYEAFKAKFGSDEIIRVVIKSDNTFAPATFRKIQGLAERLADIRGVRRVISLPDLKKKVDPAGDWSLEKFEEVLAPAELFRKNLISDDRRVCAITLFLDNDADPASIIRQVNAVIDAVPAGFSLYQIGMPLVSQALVSYTIKDFQRLPVLTLIVMMLVLFVLFRNLVAVFLPLTCVGIALIWTLGMMAYLHVSLSLLTMVVPVFIIAVGTAYCLHIFSEYSACIRHFESRREAVAEVFSRLSLPCLLVVFTTIFGVGSLGVNRIEAIRQFAFFACLGLLSLLVTILFFLPAVLVLIPQAEKKAERTHWSEILLNRILKTIVHLVSDRQKTSLLIIASISLLAVIGIFYVRIETNPVDYFKRDTPISRNFHDIYQKLSGSFPVNLVLHSATEYYFEDPDHIAEINRFQQYLKTLPYVDKTLSFADYVMLVNYALNQYAPEHYTIPKEGFEVRAAINNYRSLLGEDVFSGFMTPELNTTNILLLTHLSSSRDFLETKKAILAYFEQHFSANLTCEVTGFGMALSASDQVLTRGQIKSLSLSMALIFGIMFLMFLSVKVGLIAIAPNCFPIILAFGLMGWLDIRLSMVTSLIASIAIGLAVDDTIHYLHKYNREFKKDLNKDRAMRDTITMVGRPIIFTTLTISIGFFILMFSHFKPTAIFGFLMVVTMLAALIGDLILLPSLMRRIELVTAWDLLRLMPSLSGMSAGFVHEMNQPLNAIKMGSEFIKMTIAQKRQIKDVHLSQVVNEISRQVDRASDLINRLSVFDQRSDFAKKAVNINEPINEVVAIIRHQLVLDSIELRLELNPSLPQIMGRKNQLAQVVYNLIINAREAINTKQKAGGSRHGQMIQIQSFQDKGDVVFSVTDTGIGIPAGNLGRILEPFFTTKEKGQGQGLGLTISHEIVRDFGGRIEVRSPEDGGAVFEVTFPGGPSSN